MTLPSKFIRLKPAILFMAAIVVAHVAVSLAAVVYARTTFAVRAPNVRMMELGAVRTMITQFHLLGPTYQSDDWYELLAAYVAARFEDATPDQKRVLFAGSSVTWMYPFDASGSVSALFESQMENAMVANASVIGAGPEAAMLTLCALAEARVKPDLILIEIPIINVISSLVHRDVAQVGEAVTCAGSPKNAFGYAHYFARRPWGLPIALILQDQYRGIDSNVPMKTSVVPDSYRFDENEVEKREASVRATIRSLWSIAKIFDVPVVFYFSPIYLPAYEQQDVDTGHIRSFVRLVEDECRKVGGKRLACVDFWTDLNQRSVYFSNVSHLNRTGAARLAELLIGTSRSLLRPADAPPPTTSPLQ